MDAYTRAADYAITLLKTFDLNIDVDKTGHFDPHPIAWRKSGLQNLTTNLKGDGLLFPVDISCVADGALLALKSLAPSSVNRLPDYGIQLVGERHHLLGLTGQGKTSANGYTYLFDTKDGRFALSLTRQEDIEILPALTFGIWQNSKAHRLDNRAEWLPRLRKTFLEFCTDEIVRQGIECGLPIAAYGSADSDYLACSWCDISLKSSSPPPRVSSPLVLDFTSLWAGPLAGRLLVDIGATVIKVESTDRPDGSRNGNQTFYDLMNGGKHCVGLNFKDSKDLKMLRTLVAKADIILEGSRPRALKQLGLDAEKLVTEMPGKTWVSITAYGRYGDGAHRIGFGDDISVEAGLPALMEQKYGSPSFVGDAIADPFTGLHAAFAAYAAYLSGGGLINLPMVNVLKHALNFGLSRKDETLPALDGNIFPYPPRFAPSQAGVLGADTEHIRESLTKGTLHAHPTG